MRGCCAALLLGGCTLALPYPSAVELCGNDVDDDYDGLLDCADTCLGPCPEDDARACADHDDDDLDGLVDYEDPGCWPLAEVTLESCASVAATDVTFDFDGTDEAWSAQGALVPDPTGTYDGLSFVAQAVPAGMRSSAQEFDILVGAVVGTRATVSAHLDPHTDYVYLALDVADAIHDVSSVVATFGHEGIQVQADTGGRSMLPMLPVDWYEISVEVVSATEVAASVSRAGTMVGTATTRVDEGAWLDGHGFRVRIDGERGGSADLVVGEVHVSRPALLPCGAASPSGVVASGLLPEGLATFDDGSVCLTGVDVIDETGVVMVPFSPVLARSTDHGVTWSPDTHRELVTPSLFTVTQTFSGASIVEGRVHTLLFDVTGASRLASSADCASVDLEATIPTGADLDVAGYAFDGTTHETFAVRGERLVARRWSAGATAFETTDVTELDPADRILRVARRGSDLVVGVDGIPEHLAVVSTSARTFTRLRRFVDVVGSGRVGACDEYDARSPILTMDPSPRVAGAAATGIVVVRCLGRETYAPAIEGIATQRLVIRAPE